MRSVVVLPQPEGPSSTTNLPSSSSSDESRTAMKSPKRLCRLVMRMSAMSVPPGRPKGLTRPLGGSERSERGGFISQCSGSLTATV